LRLPGAGAADFLAQDIDPEPSGQVWLNVVLSGTVSEKLHVEYDYEAAKQVSGNGDPWNCLYGNGPGGEQAWHRR